MLLSFRQSPAPGLNHLCAWSSTYPLGSYARLVGDIGERIFKKYASLICKLTLLRQNRTKSSSLFWVVSKRWPKIDLYIILSVARIIVYDWQLDEGYSAAGRQAYDLLFGRVGIPNVSSPLSDLLDKFLPFGVCVPCIVQVRSRTENNTELQVRACQQRGARVHRKEMHCHDSRGSALMNWNGCLSQPARFILTLSANPICLALQVELGLSLSKKNDSSAFTAIMPSTQVGCGLWAWTVVCMYIGPLSSILLQSIRTPWAFKSVRESAKK